MPGHSPTSACPGIKRACDACHRRKVKCIGDGTQPCRNCASASLTCTYNAVPQKKGPKGSRAKVISELRDSQRWSQIVAQRNGFHRDAPSSPVFVRRPGLLSMDIITRCVDYFFANLYPTQPILHRQKVGDTIALMDTNSEAYCLVSSLCAYMMIQPNMVLPLDALNGLDVSVRSSTQLGHILLQETIRVRKGCDYAANPTVWSVITSFFLFGSYFCLDQQNTAWFYLREATTLAHVVGMQDEDTYRGADLVETSRRRRLYFLLFVTERAYALQKHKPLSLYATIKLPTLDEDPAETGELNGFLHLVNLFRPFDDTFVGLWNKTRDVCTTDWLADLQQQLSDALPEYLETTESQAVDLRCSQLWLKTMVWQLSISHGFLSSTTSENAMSFRYPIEIARDLVDATRQFSRQSMEVHGIGLIEKLFDIACALIDVIYCVPCDGQAFDVDPRGCLHQLMTLISTLRGGHQRYIPLLLSKINDSVPSQLPGPRLSTSGYTFPGPSEPDELYEDSGTHSSTSTSGVSSPFDSPYDSPYGSPAPSSAIPSSTSSSSPSSSSPFGCQELKLGLAPTSEPSYPAVTSAPLQYGRVLDPVPAFRPLNYLTRVADYDDLSWLA